LVIVNQVGTSDLVRNQNGLLAERYVVLRRLAEGASGEVYLVQHKSRDTQLVLKLLPTLAAAHQVRAEFARLTELGHPNIVKVVDAGVLAQGADLGRAFIVMDYVPGPTLSDLLSSTDEPVGRLQRFCAASEALMDALAYLHGHAVIHGDVSPANVRCDEAGKPVLLDFGLSFTGTSRPSGKGASGTLGYIAPEALLGERGPAGDLFALGATLYEAWTGTPPFGTGLDAIKRAWSGPPSPPSLVQAGLPSAWDELLLRLISAAAQDRPTSAREALQQMRASIPDRALSVEADLAVPFPAGDPLAGVVVGRNEEELWLRRHIEQLVEGTAGASVLFVSGPPSSGRRTVIGRVLRDVRLAVLSETLPDIDVEETDCSELLARQGKASAVPDFALDTAENPKADLAHLVDVLEKRAQARPLCLALSGSAEDRALAMAIASSPPSGRLLALLPSERTAPCEGGRGITLGPLSREAIAELARRGAGIDPPTRILDEIVASSSGLAGACAVLVRSWIRSVRDGNPDRLGINENSADLARLLDASFSDLSTSARIFVVTAGLSVDARASLGDSDWAATEGEQEARAAGWISSAAAALPSELHWDALWRALARDAHLQSVARPMAMRLPEGDVRRAEVHLALGEGTEASALFWQAMREACARMAWSRAVYSGLRARKANPTSGTSEDCLLLTHALGVLGRYDEALSLLEPMANAGTSAGLARIAERRAWLLGRRGDPEGARTILEEALRQLGEDRREVPLLRARLARLLVSLGRYPEAFAVAQPILEERTGAGIAAREVAVLALVYAGDISEARTHWARLAAEIQGTVDRSQKARVAALEGLLEQMAGRPVLAADAYRQAVADYDLERDLHGAAAATFNLGCTLAELGNFTGAIVALEGAIRDLGRLGAVADHALAVFNVGELFVQLGDVAAANRAATRLQAEARASHLDAFEGYAWLLLGNLRRREQRAHESLSSFGSALDVFARLGMRTAATLARFGQAEALAMLSDVAGAHSILRDIEIERGRDKPGDTRAMDPESEQFVVTRARVVLGDSTAQKVDWIALAETLLRTAKDAAALGRRPMAWRMASLAFQLFSRAQDPRAHAALESARATLMEVKMNTPAKYWPGLDSDNEARVLEMRPADGRGDAELVQRAAVLEGRLRRLLRINKRLNSDLRLSRVLETIIDTVIELTDAERGFLLLKDGHGELVVKVARNIDQTSLEGPNSSLSRSIAKQAADSGEPVVTVDAAGDSRFSELLSVSDLHLRSVLAVPLAVKGNVVGTLYVDHRLRKGVFGEDEIAMVLDFAEQGAIAIENARMLSELRRREQQVQSLNRRLERELKVQEATLSDVRCELKASRQVAALRYDYRQIVGQSTGMLDLFRLLDRVTDTNLPVVIEGESGTGKELVARAIHFHGPRKDKAFVSENCAAIPETLLESALFGHARGSFTGAERETRGLFSIANGGTLFLDEVAEMSPAMQGKLLRVLQEGEFHRVGSERAEKVDVRILVATNKNLSQMVEDGKFRKDLFYRLTVVRLHLPPLRERREDIPLLVSHFLAKAAQSGAGPKPVDPPAMARLVGYAWPGNVRELENEIARAAVFSGATITVADLSPHVQSGLDPSEVVRDEPDSLRLRQRVERLERQLIREALGKSQGNQTKASALLGLSRFGLQKKLRRYSLGN
jgi:serine/threonine-protein kinase PknK